jgi:membrane-associated progesterone receptor component
MSLEVQDVDNSSIEDLSLSELDALSDWCMKFDTKYKVVGHLVEEPEQRDYTLEELLEYDGTHGTKPLLLVMRGVVYHVTNGWSFYGPNGGYSFLAGHDASRALAKMSLEPAMVQQPVVLDDLSDTENQTLNDWIAKLSLKYPVVGNVI